MKLTTITAITTLFALMLSGCASTPTLNGSVNGLGEGKYRAYNTAFAKQGLIGLADSDMQLTCNRAGKAISVIISQEESRKGEIKSGNKAMDTAMEFTKFGKMMGDKSSENPYELISIFKCE